MADETTTTKNKARLAAEQARERHTETAETKTLDKSETPDGEVHTATSTPATNAGIVDKEQEEPGEPSTPTTNAGPIEGDPNPEAPRHVDRLNDVVRDGKDRTDLPDTDAQRLIPKEDAFRTVDANADRKVTSTADLGALDERLEAKENPDHTAVEHVDVDPRPRDVQRFGSFQDELLEIDRKFKDEVGTLDDLNARRASDISAAKTKYGIA